MIGLGIDEGSLATKALILKDDQILAWSVKPTDISRKSITGVLDDVLNRTGLRLNEIKNIISTGIGKKEVGYATGTLSEVSCAVRGAAFLFPGVRTVVDIGGQNCRAIRCDGDGEVIGFALNDKCAAGTGIFLTSMAKALEVDIGEMGQLSRQSTMEVNITSMCVVFAESEVVTLIHRSVPKADIIRGLHKSIAMRVNGLVHSVGLESRAALVGGVAKNAGVVSCLEDLFKQKVFVPGEPQLVCALGAAAAARERGGAN